eukprot:Polyplicarium_translucidae@DN3040_c0_g1_i4.p1
MARRLERGRNGCCGSLFTPLPEWSAAAFGTLRTAPFCFCCLSVESQAHRDLPACARSRHDAMTAPTKVLLFRNLSQTVTEVDVENFVRAFFPAGTQPKIYLQASAGHAFVEFPDANSASSALEAISLRPVVLKGSTVAVSFSKRGAVTTLEEKQEVFRVVLASVTNILYPVDIELLGFLFSRVGYVEKIVTFSKTPTMYQALVQFRQPEEARRAMTELHNRNIYNGCNTLQIHPSRLPELVVKENSPKAWDYTIRQGGATPSQPTAILATPAAAGAQQTPPGASPFPTPAATPNGQACFSPAASNPPSTNAIKRAAYEKLPRELREANLELINPLQTAVLIVYKLNTTEVTVTKLFNLFSMYGTVLRIKILRDRTDTALIQYSEPLYASVALHLLQGCSILHSNCGVQIHFSKHSEVKGAKQFTPRDQRYSVEDSEKYLRGATRPTATLFVANVPETMSESELKDLFAGSGDVAKVQFKLPTKETVRKKMAYIEMAREADAIASVCNLHNSVQGNAPLKLAFTRSVIRPPPRETWTDLQQPVVFEAGSATEE